MNSTCPANKCPKKIVIGNWNLNPVDVEKSKELLNEIEKEIVNIDDLEHVMIGVVVMDYAIWKIRESIAKSKISVEIGSQSFLAHLPGFCYLCVFEQGRSDPFALMNFGCSFSLLGHSEQRKFDKLTDDEISSDLQYLDSSGCELKVILCIGESKEERDSEKTKEVIENQLRSLKDILTKNGSFAEKVIVAYEPIWALEAGVVVTVDQVTKAIDDIKKILHGFDIKVLYGGSVNSKNCDELAAINSLDGFLVGEASVKADEFAKIISAASEKCK